MKPYFEMLKHRFGDQFSKSVRPAGKDLDGAMHEPWLSAPSCKIRVSQCVVGLDGAGVDGFEFRKLIYERRENAFDMLVFQDVGRRFEMNMRHGEFFFIVLCEAPAAE